MNILKNVTTYRYAFNGKEQDSEISGTGNSYDYGARVYNPRVGRFLSVDPLFQTYPWFTPYQFASNTPIQAIDVDGFESVIVHKIEQPDGPAQRVFYHVPPEHRPHGEESEGVSEFVGSDFRTRFGSGSGVNFKKLSEDDITPPRDPQELDKTSFEGIFLNRRVRRKGGTEIATWYQALTNQFEVEYLGRRAGIFTYMRFGNRTSLNIEFEFGYLDAGGTNYATPQQKIKAENYAKGLATYLVDNPNLNVNVVGNTDSKGTEEKNLKLSNARAEKIAGLIVEMAKRIDPNFDEKRVSSEGRGESNPIAPNTNDDGSDNPQGRQQNRRVDLEFSESTVGN